MLSGHFLLKYDLDNLEWESVKLLYLTIATIDSCAKTVRKLLKFIVDSLLMNLFVCLCPIWINIWCSCLMIACDWWTTWSFSAFVFAVLGDYAKSMLSKCWEWIISWCKLIFLFHLLYHSLWWYKLYHVSSFFTIIVKILCLWGKIRYVWSFLDSAIIHLIYFLLLFQVFMLQSWKASSNGYWKADHDLLFCCNMNRSEFKGSST